MIYFIIGAILCFCICAPFIWRTKRKNVDVEELNEKLKAKFDFLTLQILEVEEKKVEAKKEFEDYLQYIQEQKQQLEIFLQDKIDAKHSVLEVLRKEELPKESIEFIEIGLNDLQTIEECISKISNPTVVRTLNMLIWKSFYQDPMNKLCMDVLGAKPITGIYKITNKNNNICYIGQAKDVSKRWKMHAKCGLGIDTPPGNKLYKAMKQEGLWNFTWELIEECRPELLDEREKYFIEFYDSKNFGYNSQSGNG